MWCDPILQQQLLESSAQRSRLEPLETPLERLNTSLRQPVGSGVIGRRMHMLNPISPDELSKLSSLAKVVALRSP